jgi:hypothetical protein
MRVQREHKILKGSLPRTTCNDLPPNFLDSCGADNVLQKALKAFAYGSFRLIAFASTFDIQADLAYHRVPPISPIRQSSPREYFSSQCFSRAASRRRGWVPMSSRSNTNTDSGVSVSAETSASECVVTMSCVRWDASTSNTATVVRMSGCNPSSGSSMHNKGGGVG